MPHRDGFHTVTPYVILRDAKSAIDFYKRAFGATEIFVHAGEKGGVRHAEIRIGDSPVMLTEECPEYPDMKSAESRGGSPVHMFLYIDDVDEFAGRAVKAGATVIMEIEDKEYGRSGGLKDPFGLTW